MCQEENSRIIIINNLHRYIEIDRLIVCLLEVEDVWIVKNTGHHQFCGWVHARRKQNKIAQINKQKNETKLSKTMSLIFVVVV